MSNNSSTNIIVTCVCVLCLVGEMLCIGFSSDSSSIIIASLGVITSVLIGFQIFNIVNIDSRFNASEKRIEEGFSKYKSSSEKLITCKLDSLSKVIDKRFTKSKNDAVMMTLTEISAVLGQAKEYNISCILCFETLSIAVDLGSDDDYGRSAIETAIKHLETIHRAYEEGSYSKRIQITDNQWNRYCKIVGIVSREQWELISSLMNEAFNVQQNQ